MKQQSESRTSGRPATAPQPDRDAIDAATLDLLESWRRSDATDNRDEVGAAERDLAEFKRAMNQNRIAANDPAVYP
jgi:hypothetical protein